MRSNDPLLIACPPTSNNLGTNPPEAKEPETEHSFPRIPKELSAGSGWPVTNNHFFWGLSLVSKHGLRWGPAPAAANI